MENFEYSIQLNDRDWAEFYLASEECCLTPPALATADDQLLSDLEEGEAEGKRLIQERAGPVPAHRKISCLAHESPSGHLLGEDVCSGSEDETDLGSVSKFLCRSLQPLLSSHSSPGQLSGLILNPLGSWPPGPATSSVPLSAAEEGGAGTAGWPMDPKTKVEAQGGDLQQPHPRPEPGERPLVLPLSLSAAQGTESPEEASGLQLQDPQDVSPTASASCTFPGSTGSFSGKLEFPSPKDAAVHPSPIRVSAVLSSASGEGENPRKEAKRLQVASRTPLKEKLSPSQEHSVQLAPLLANVREKASGKKQEETGPLESERALGLSPDPVQEGDRAEDNGVKESLGALEENEHPKPSRGAEATLSGKVEKQNNGEPCLHLARVIAPEGVSPLEGNPRLASYHLKPNDSSEDTLATMTWPEVCDYFFRDDPEEPERPTQEETNNDHQPELPATSGPEMYEYFFHEADESTGHEESGVQAGPSEISPGSDCSLAPSGVLEKPGPDVTAEPMGFPEVCEHFFAHRPQEKRNWRQTFLLVPASELGKAVRALTSFVCRPVRFLQSQPRRRGSQVRVMLVSPTLVDGRYPRPENLGVAVLQPERPLQLALTPRDMCLGFVAFASWAVKTADPRAPDAWKIVLLANFGTLSAIRYFRQHIVMGSYHGT